MNNIIKYVSDLVDNGELEIRVDRDVRWGKQVVLDFQDGEKGRSAKEIEGSNEVGDQIRDLIIEIDDIKEKYDNLDKGWHIGRVAEKEVGGSNDLSNGDFAVLTDLGYSKDGTYVGQMRNVYNIFPDQGYAGDLVKASYMGEITQLKGISNSKVREINTNVQKQGIKIKKKHVRSLRAIWNLDNLEQTVENVVDRAEFNGSSPSEIQKVLAESYNIMGYSIDKSEINDKITNIY